MTSPPTKKPRLTSTTAPSLQSKVLSYFALPPPHPPCPPLPLSSSDISSALISHCHNLVCLSKQSAQSSLNALLSELNARVYAPSHLAAALFLDDDALPSLCVLVHLLHAHVLQIPDLQQRKIFARAIDEVEKPELCACRGVYPGLTALFKTLLDEGERGEKFLHAFVAVLFGDAADVTENVKRFRVARITIEIVKKQADVDADRLLTMWLKQAVLPTRLTGTNVGADVCNVWTPEVSGLATGRDPAEYLEGGALEAKALLTLYTAVSPATASEVFVESMHVLIAADAGAVNFQQRAPGTLARIVLLEQRVAERGLSEVDVSRKRAMECSLAAALYSAQVQSDAQTTAILLCLARRLFLPRAWGEGSVDNTRGFADYEQWLKDIVRGNDWALAKALIKALTELIHLEPLRLLRTNHRVFSGNKLHMRMFGDYLIQVRARISDIDPLQKAENKTIYAKDLESQLPPLESRRKAEVDVTKFVTEFARSGGKIPATLVRQMNFHRYHFRANTLPVLLNPSLEPKTEGALPLLMDKEAFDEQRINLIRVMAFKRKDHSVTREEAQIAIEAITDVQRKSLQQKVNEDQAQPDSGSGGPVSGENISITQTIKFALKQILKRADSTQCSAKGVNGKPVNIDEGTLLDLAGQLEEHIAKSEGSTAIAEFAAATLQGILDAFTTEVCEIGIQSSEQVFEQSRRWWQGYGAILRAVLITVIGRKNVRPLQRHLQCHLFALVCMQAQALTPAIVRCLAQLIAVIAALVGNSHLAELCYLPQPGTMNARLFVRAVFECLSLRDAVKVRRSVKFAIHSVYLLKVAKHEEILFTEQTEKADDIDDSTGMHGKPGHTLHRFFMDPLQILLRWVLSVPWRLLADKEDEEQNLVDENIICDAENMLRTSTDILSSEILSMNERVLIRKWLETEYRCGWGRPKAVRRVLESFCRSGMHPCEVIGESCIFLAGITVAQGGADWIQRGLLLYADESFSQRQTSAEKAVRNSSPLCDFLCLCVDMHGVEKGSRMLHLISSTSHWYFGDMQFRRADTHVTENLIPWFWPLSSRCLKYLLRSLDKCGAAALSEGRSSTCEVFLISNMVMQWDNLANDMQDWKLGSAQLRSLMTRVRDTKRCIDLLVDTGGSNHERLSQLPRSLDSSLTSISEKYPQILGTCIIVFLANKCVENQQNSDMFKKPFVGMISVLVCSVPAVIVADVIDAMLYASALVPFAHRFSECGEYEIALEAMQFFSKRLLEERMNLPGANAPVWIREKQSSRVISEDDYRRTLMQWLGRATTGNNGNKAGYLESSLAVSVCMGRIYATIKDISNETLSLFFGGVGDSKAISELMPNILTVYRTLTRQSTDFAREKLSLKRWERLLTYRILLKNRLLGSLSHVVAVLQSKKLPNIHEDVNIILSDFPEQAEEVRLHLRNHNQLYL